jgi:hypothetical protein
MADRILEARSPAGCIFACISEGVRFTEGKVADRRLGAILTPFRDEGSARCALAAAGASDITEGGRK